MTGFVVSVDGTLGWVLLAASPVAALLAAWWAWRRTEIRDGRVRAAVAALRGAFVLVAMILLADPSLTRTVERRPRLAIAWDGGPSLATRDSPEGATRREALDSVLGRATSGGLDRRFDLVDFDAMSGTDAAATLVLAADAGAVDVAERNGRVVVVSAPRDPDVPDVSVLSVELPARAATGSPIEAIATVRARGAAGRKVVVTLSDGTRVARSASRDVTAADETFSVALGAILQSVGWRKVTVEAAGVTGEVSIDDNRLERWIELEPVTRRVLFIESTPSWEGKFIRRALEKDATLRVDSVTSVSKDAVVVVQSVEGKPTNESASVSPKKPKPAGSGDGPASIQSVLGNEKRLFSYDAIVLGPLDAAAVSESDAARLVRFVDARGGGLIVLGGNAYAGSVISSRGALSKVMPADVSASSLGRSDGKAHEAGGSVVLAPADGFAGHPSFSMLGDDPASTLGKLQKLGKSYMRLGALAAGAEAIAVDGTSSTAAPLVVAHRYGAGRVTIVAPPDTWRMSVGATTELEDVSAKFWTGLVGWTAAGARPPVRAWAEPTAVSTAAPARFVLEARGPDWTPMSAARIDCRAELESAGTEGTDPVIVDVRFVADVANPGRFVATVALPSPGTWLVTAEIDGQETTIARVEVREGAADAVRPDPSAEAAVESALVARGGALVRDGNVDALLEAVGTPETMQRTETSRPARGIWWAFVLPLLFVGEAFLRRRAGADAENEAPQDQYRAR